MIKNGPYQDCVNGEICVLIVEFADEDSFSIVYAS